MKVVSLASGSKGNAYVLQSGDAVMLVDAGLTCKELLCRLDAMGFSCEQLVGVVLTHSHIDHVGALKTLVRKTGVAVYANAMTAESVAVSEGVDEDAFTCFENGQKFNVGPFEVTAFSIPHDTSDPVGYLIRAEGHTYFHGTDIGTPLDSIGVKLSEADIATLESNHDAVMLRTSGRAPSLIQRIAGPRGHLSNDQTGELVRKFVGENLTHLALAHLSHDCNTDRCARETMMENLKRIGRESVKVCVLSQAQPVVIYDEQ